MPLPPEVAQCMAEAKSALLALETATESAFKSTASDDERAAAVEAEKSKSSEATARANKLEEELRLKRDVIEDLQVQLAEGGVLLRQRETEAKQLQKEARRLGDRLREAKQRAEAAQGKAEQREPLKNIFFSQGSGPRRASRSRDSDGRASRGSRSRSRSRDGGPGGEDGDPSAPSRGRLIYPRGAKRAASRDRSSQPPQDEEGEDEGDEGRRAGSGGGRDSSDIALCIPFVVDQCTRGDTCPHRHPRDDDILAARQALQRKPCRYGAECKRSDCIFSHDDYTQQAPEPRESRPDRLGSRAGGDARVTPCRYGQKCSRPNCKFGHEVWEQPAPAREWPAGHARGGSKTPCRYGSGCKRPDCRFAHP